MRRLAVLVAAAAVAGLVAGAAQARLTPAEQKWATPLINVWNRQNGALQLVIPIASSKNALVAGTANNLKLTNVLVLIVTCKQAIAKAGSPPSPRLTRFLSSLQAACAADTKGANAFAKAVGAVRKKNGALAQSYLKSGVSSFRVGTSALTKAYKSLIAIGGSSIFKA